jgi:uncharacterized protein YozE (UPF0346 family)
MSKYTKKSSKRDAFKLVSDADSNEYDEDVKPKQNQNFVAFSSVKSKHVCKAFKITLSEYDEIIDTELELLNGITLVTKC